ncbi:MAG: type II toxin-antitoxin system RelE/ParE family toxin [Spirochaetia bacterium]|nr:type II toxin-antitoxin system RelE/ParE family toxin [Spirochaetia bacterium]
MIIRQTNQFEKSYKKLHKNQLKDANNAIRSIINNPLIGILKKGDLSDVRVHKFKMANQLTLIAYTYEDNEIILTFLTIGSHENFYRDLKI